MSWKWFGVKTLTRWETFGEPASIDENYDEDIVFVEERVVLIKARSFDEAIKKGEKEARDDLSEYPNFYGQTVKQRYLEVCDAFELFEEPKESGVEVFSSIECVSKTVDDSIIIENKFGKEQSIESFKSKGMKFRAADLPKVRSNKTAVKKILSKKNK